MFRSLWRALRNEDYIGYLKAEIEAIRAEKDVEILKLHDEKLELQSTLFKTLKIHLIPNTREELIRESGVPTQVKIPTRSVRQFLSDKQRDSWDASTKTKIDQIEREIRGNSDINTNGVSDVKKVG